jgi:hypothetical protein
MKNTKHQTPNTKKPANSNLRLDSGSGVLGFDGFEFFDVWCLVFGIYSR